MGSAGPVDRVRAALAGLLPSESLTAEEARRFDSLVDAKIEELLPLTDMAAAGTDPVMRGMSVQTIDGQTSMVCQTPFGDTIIVAVDPATVDPAT